MADIVGRIFLAGYFHGFSHIIIFDLWLPSYYRSYIQSKGDYPIAQQLDSSELVSFKELLMANTIQVDTAVQLLIEKGFFTEAEYFTRLKQV
jgi:hypothetical protein